MIARNPERLVQESKNWQDLLWKAGYGFGKPQAPPAFVILIKKGQDMRGLFLATLTVEIIMSASLHAGVDATQQSSDELKRLEGTWSMQEGELGGTRLPEQATKAIRLVLAGNRYTVTTSEGADEGNVRLVPDEKPSAMDIAGTKGPNQGKTFPAIYELKDDTLKICYDLAGKQRPKTFETKAGTQLFLATYRRVKPER
jgi:uncharacterized protein (TIGR03067 family)